MSVSQPHKPGSPPSVKTTLILGTVLPGIGAAVLGVPACSVRNRTFACSAYGRALRRRALAGRKSIGDTAVCTLTYRRSLGSGREFYRLFRDGDQVTRTMLRFHFPFIEPDVQISRIRLSDKASIGCLLSRRSTVTPSVGPGNSRGVFWRPVSLPSPRVALP